jgi:hypothetical protein
LVKKGLILVTIPAGGDEYLASQGSNARYHFASEQTLVNTMKIVVFGFLKHTQVVVMEHKAFITSLIMLLI